MKFKSRLLLTIVIALLVGIIACQASTFKPFVRSRYSLRWRKTTETPKVLDSTTTAPKLESVGTTQAIKYTETSQNVVLETTVPAVVKTSTHPPDYDYYGNNEVEENEHKLIH